MSVKQVFNTSAELDYPTVLPTLDLDFANSKTLDPRITFTRASGGSYTDVNGLIKLAGVNEPRFDHDPVTGESLGFLVEESRTNLHLYSEDLSNWNAETGATISSNAYLSPNGTQTADGINGTIDGSSAYIITTLSNATTYTFSVFLKYISGVTSIEIQIGDEPFSRSLTTFNVQTGTLLSNTGGTATVNSIQNYGNGWYRYSITRTTAASGGAFIDINHRTTTPSTVAVWGAQIEQGSFPTSYIPTEGSSRTRAADVAGITGKNFSDFYRQDEGTFIGDWFTNGSANGQPFLLEASDSGRSIILYIIRETAGTGRVGQYGATAGGDFDFLNLGVLANNQKAKLGLAYKKNDAAGVMNGGTLSTDTQTGTITPDRLGIGNLGNVSGGYQPNGCIKRITYYPKRLTNQQLQTLTT